MAVFLDRDGTINEEVNFVKNPDEFILIPGVGLAISKLNKLGLKVFVISNQSGVARGFFTEQTLSQIHDKMNKLLLKQDAVIDDIFYCPHHPDAIIPEYKANCNCRKPLPGMLYKAKEKYNINLDESFVIGDMDRDIELGLQNNMHTILVLTGKGNETLQSLQQNGKAPDFIANNLLEAVEYIEKKLND
ncbi:MAG TPA: D-glycero-beta-D-manno-heptose 1,7-bisphosphate 7-phosphatase [Ignavibacteria bacterium]